MKTEFLYQNEINTTTMISVTTGTSTVSDLFDRKKSQQYQSSGDNDDTTGTTITIAFSATTTVDRIAIQNHNLKDFTLYYNGTTTNLFSLASGNITSSSDFTSNSQTDLYIHFGTAIDCTSVSIVASATIAANEEKKIGELWITHQNFALNYNPSAKQYNAKLDRKEYAHEMSDGGTALYVLEENYSADIGLTFQSQTVRDNLYNLYNQWSEFVFVPFPTGTTWDSEIYEVNWIRDFDFKSYSDDYFGNGFEGKIRLRETPK